MGFGDGTGKSINHMGARDDFWPFRHFEHLQLSLLPQPLLGIFRFLFRVSLQPVGGEQFGLPGMPLRPLGQSAGTHGREAAV